MATASKKAGYNPIILCSNLDLNGQPNLPRNEFIDSIQVKRYKSKILPKWRWIKSRKIEIEGIIKELGKFKLTKNDIILARDHSSAYAASKFSNGEIKVFYIPPCIFVDYEIKNFYRLKKYKKIQFFKLKLFIIKYIKGLVNNYIQKYAINNAYKNLLPSRLFIDQFIDHFPSISRNRYVHLPFGVDIERFRPIEKIKFQKPNDFNFSIETFNILFLGRLAPQKGIILAIKSLKPIKDMNFHLYIIGDGGLKNEIIELINIYGLDSKVTLLGSKNDPEKYLPYGDILLYPNTYESFGNTLTESLASGLPVLCFKNKPPLTEIPNEEIIDDGITGWVVEPYEHILTKAIVKTMNLKDRDLLQMRCNARKTAVEKYSWENYLKTIINL